MGGHLIFAETYFALRFSTIKFVLLWWVRKVFWNHKQSDINQFAIK